MHRVNKGIAAEVVDICDFIINYWQSLLSKNMGNRYFENAYGVQGIMFSSFLTLSLVPSDNLPPLISIEGR